jgi:hypothetical protein
MMAQQPNLPKREEAATSSAAARLQGPERYLAILTRQCSSSHLPTLRGRLAILDAPPLV